MPESYEATLRDATPKDLANILRFFEDANDPNVLPRPKEDYQRSVESGGFYLIEVDGQLVAAAGVFYLNEYDIGPLEMGACYVVPAFRGFKLQKLLVLPRVAYATILDDEDAPIYTAIKPDNLPSRKSVMGVGFEPLQEHVPLLFEPCAACKSQPDSSSDRKCCCDFFHIPMYRKCSEIRKLLAFQTVTLPRKDGAHMMVTLDVQLLTEPLYCAALKSFVNSPKCQTTERIE